MNSQENIKKIYEQAKLDTLVEKDKAVLEKMKEIYLQQSKAEPETSEISIWRIIMKSKISKLAAAAVIIIACSISLVFWKSTSSGIALADVLTRIEQVTAYMYQIHSTVKKQQTSTESIITVLISEEHGLKMVRSTVDPESGESKASLETYLSHRPNSMAFVIHQGKMYWKFKYEDDRMRFYREECSDPRIIIKQILSCEHTSLGQSIIDGITVEGFQTTDLDYEGGFFSEVDLFDRHEKVEVKLWVDVDTFLPVRSEEYITMKDGRHIQKVSYDFRWNVVVNADDFRPVVPEDYITDQMVFPEYNEESAIEGLRLFASLAGAYPVNLNKKTLDIEAPRILHLGDHDSWETVPEDERNRKMSELASITAVGFFYEKLVDENKEPAYYGDTVEPGDADKVLLRWKLDDGQYRVIFVDLSTKTVTAEELSELEKP